MLSHFFLSMPDLTNNTHSFRKTVVLQKASGSGAQPECTPGLRNGRLSHAPASRIQGMQGAGGVARNPYKTRGHVKQGSGRGRTQVGTVSALLRSKASFPVLELTSIVYLHGGRRIAGC